MFVIPRESLRGIDSVQIDGRVHTLGLVKDLRWHPEFARHVPPAGELSVSWVRLLVGETLAVHRHPTTSVIIVTEGQGELLGARSGPVGAGDVVVVPPGDEHGFRGAGERGFWALSLQFEGRGLYHDPERPRTRFVEARLTESKLERLLAAQAEFCRRYRDNPLVRLTREPLAPTIRARLLEGLQLWADCFQRVLAARVSTASDPRYQRLAEEHMGSEVGHNHRLAHLRGGPTPAWDPELAALSSWFVDRVRSATQEEQAVLVHFVLEGSGQIFHDTARACFGEVDHFVEHGVFDHEHFEMAVRVLRDEPDLDLPRLSEALRQGWAIMELLSARIAEVAVGDVVP
jgi:quercetin dioxygenase-like cupin family protein